MSIRLRLTLLYSAIVALILAIFSLILYFGQVQATFNDYQRRLANRVPAVGSGAEQLLPPPVAPPSEGQPLPPPGEGGQLLPPADGQGQPPPGVGQPPLSPLEPLYTQRRSLDGEIIAYDPNVGDTLILPLNDATLQAIQRGQARDEIVWIGDERFLVHSQRFRRPNQEDEIVQVAVSLENRDQNLATLRNTLVMGGLITVLIAFGVGWVLAGLALRPIKRITQTAQVIGAERNFSRRIDHPGPNDEVGQLAATFNNMLTELQGGYQQVEHSLLTQRRFVADASHELRTPLTTIRGNIDLLQREPPISEEDRVDVLSDTVNETERLMRLVNNLLVLARADAKRPLRSEPVPIEPLLQGVHSQMKRLAPPRTINCRANALAEAVVMGDHDAIKQVLLVLGDNALKHTPREATIVLTGAVVGEHVTISVGDNGPGIEPEKLSHIFDRFYRGDDSRVGPGTGLGLAIAKELTEAQNGTLAVKSQVGRGTVFTLTFPKLPANTYFSCQT